MESKCRKTGTLYEADEAKRKKTRDSLQVSFIWVLIISVPLAYCWGYATGFGVSPAGDSRPPLSGYQFPMTIEECIRYYTGTDREWILELLPDNHLNAQLVQDDPTMVWVDGDNLVIATEADPELYWITHYGPPTFTPTDVTAWGMTIAESLEWAEQLEDEWGTSIKGICAAHRYTPWYEKNIYPPVLLKIEGRGNYLVLDRKGNGDSVGVDLYEPDQDGPMYNYKGEVTEIVGWWCE